MAGASRVSGATRQHSHDPYKQILSRTFTIIHESPCLIHPIIVHTQRFQADRRQFTACCRLDLGHERGGAIHGTKGSERTYGEFEAEIQPTYISYRVLRATFDDDETAIGGLT